MESEDEQTELWTVEGWGSLYTSERIGVTSDDFSVGDRVRLPGFLSTRASNDLLGTHVLLADGAEAVLRADAEPRWSQDHVGGQERWAAKMNSEIEVRQEQITSATAMNMISALNAEMTSIYPEPGANHFRLDPEEVVEGVGAFLVAWHEREPVGCGAIRRLDDDTAEIKRMYVDPGKRGFGVGRVLLSALEEEAKRLKVNRIVLETGVRLVQAMGLYESCGFHRIPSFGKYVESNHSVCLEKRLR